MYLGPDLSTQPTAVIVHLGVAVAALVIGPFALWSRKGTPRHRALGYVWIAMMLAAAVSSLFIRDFRMPNLGGYTLIHTLSLATFAGVGLGIWHVMRRDVGRHQVAMRFTYRAALIAGAFALLPTRYLGGLLWQHTLGLY